MSTGAENACDFLKAFRAGWMTCEEVQLEVGVCDSTARRWVHEMELQGFLVSRERAGFRGRRTGQPPLEYTLAPAWRGASA